MIKINEQIIPFHQWSHMQVKDGCHQICPNWLFVGWFYGLVLVWRLEQAWLLGVKRLFFFQSVFTFPFTYNAFVMCFTFSFIPYLKMTINNPNIIVLHLQTRQCVIFHFSNSISISYAIENRPEMLCIYSFVFPSRSAF